MSATWKKFGVVALSVCASSCNRGERIASANEELRATNAELQGKVDSLTGQVAELEAQLKVAQQTPTTLPDEVRANVPYVAKIGIGRLSHVRDSDGDGAPDTLILYLAPEDGRGRFVQIVGSVDVNAAILPVKADAITIARENFTPSQVRDAYRSSFTGVHYTLESPIEWPAQLNLESVAKVIVSVVYTDGLTGQTFAADRSISLK